VEGGGCQSDDERADAQSAELDDEDKDRDRDQEGNGEERRAAGQEA